MALDKLYEQVSGSEDTLDHLGDEKTLKSFHGHTGWKRTALIAATLTAISIAIIILTCSLVFQHRHAGGELDVSVAIISCGQSPEEARASGCKYDVMMQLWVPVECYDEALSERFLAEGNWPWFADIRAQHEISLEVMRLGEHQVAFSTDQYHRYHCIFTWEVMVRAMRARGYIVEEMMSYDHVVHCRHMTLPPPHNKTLIAVEAHSGYTRCATYDTWIHALPEDEISSIT